MSDAEEAFAFQLRAVRIAFDREVKFAADRKWRADFVIRGRWKSDNVIHAGPAFLIAGLFLANWMKHSELRTL